MADNALQTVQKVLQDLIAPDVRETRVRLEAFETRTDAEFVAVRSEISSARRETVTEFQAVRRENDSFRKEMEARTDQIQSRIEQIEKRTAETEARTRDIEANTRAILASIAELKVNGEVTALREISSLRERVAVLEAARQPH